MPATTYALQKEARLADLARFDRETDLLRAWGERRKREEQQTVDRQLAREHQQDFEEDERGDYR